MTDNGMAIWNTLWKTFLVALLAQFIALGSDVFALNWESAKAILSAGIAAAVMFLYNYFSKSFPLYGKGAE